jgi:hypothetical protein
MFEGTDGDNRRDMLAKGRYKAQRGEDNIQAKLTEAAVLEIRKHKLSIRKLAFKFGVSYNCVRQVITRRKWGHI